MYPLRRTGTLVASAALLFALVGCTPGVGSGGSGTGSDSDDGGAAAGTTPMSCIADRTWVLNKDDLAAQLAANLTANGLVVTQSTADGRQTFEFNSDGSATAFVDVTYTLTVDSDGLVMTLVQTHSGEPSGEWQLLDDGSTVTFDSWDNAGYTVQNSILIGGVAADMPLDIPSDTLGETDMTTVCSGNTLSTKVEVSPFTQHWIAED